MGWFGGGRRRGVWRSGALALVAAAVTLVCVAAGVTLADVGPSGASARASARLGTGTSRSGKTSESLGRTAHSRRAGLAGSSHASVNSASVLDGLPLAPSAASTAGLMGTDASSNAANHSVGATAAAVDPLTCTTGTIYSSGAGSVLGGTGNQALYSLATTSLGGSSVPATLVAAASGGNTGAINALGITAGGTAAYWINKSNGTVFEYNAAANTVTALGSSGVSSGNLNLLNAGAINTANGFFYYGYATTTGTMVLFAFNTNTNTLVGQIATATAPFFSNGDIAFDAGGNLYWVGSSGTTAALGVIPGPIPTTASTTRTLTGKTITTYADPTSAQFDGIAFDNTGNLYLQFLNQLSSNSTTFLEQVDPLSGAVNAGPTVISPDIAGTDLGACATNPSLSLQKNVVGRIQASDQFTLAITGPGISGSTTGATATTSGTSTGIQAQQAGPLPVISGNTYTLTETATNNNLSNSYTSTYSCTSSATGGTVASGTGTSFTLTVPTPGTGQTGPAIVCVFTNTPLTSSLSITKSATPTTVTTVGQTVTYHYTVMNTGQTPLTSVHVTDTQQAPASGLTSGPTCQSLSTPTGTCSGSSTSLAVGQSASFTATYTVTQADLDHGSINDSATATGTPPSGPDATSPPSTATVTATQSPALSIMKSAVPASVSTLGQTVTYTFAVKNTGNVDLSAVHVTDTQQPPAGGLASGPTCQSLSSPTGTCSGSSTSLAPGQSASFTATYTVTQADLDHGSINDSATATGTPPTGPSVTSPPSTASVPVTQNPALSVVKSAVPASVSAVGQTVTYTFAVKNTGNVDLSAVHVTDTQQPPAGGLASGPTCQSLSSPTGTCSGSSTSLAPGQSASFTATYTVTQADLDHGSINDSATATGTPPTGPSVTSPPSTASVPVTQNPALSVVKSAVPASVSAVGQTVTYTFAVKNTGNVDLSAVHVTDTQQPPAGGLASGPTCQSLSSPTGTCSGSSTSLAPGQSASFTATYTVTQADLDHGSINDSATATGTPPTGPSVTSPPSTATVTATQNPALTITKSAVPASVSAVGQTVTYTFAVKNTGNVDLSAVHVTDTQQPPAGGLASGPTCQSLSSPTGTCSGSSTSLAPGQVATFTATYTVTQADLDHGSIHDSATATGTPPTGPSVTSPPATATVTAAQSPALSIVKSASPASVSAVGQTVTYTFAVTNTGNVDLTGVSVADTQQPPAGGLASGPTCQSLSSPTGTCSGSSTSLAPGQVATFTATYIVTQADLNHGSINDSATATGTPPTGPSVTSPPSTASVPVTQNPALSIVKSASPASVSAVGDTVTYTFAVTNTGNVNLTAVSVADTQEPPAGGLASGPTCQSLSSPTGTCSGSSTSLAPGQVATFTATYIVTQADLNHGSINDSATATGTPPTGPSVTSPPSTASVPVTQNPALSIVKSASPASVSAVGDTVTYTFAVTNTGNVDLSGVHVTDTQQPPAGGLASGPTCHSLSSPTGSCSGSSTSLAVGQSATFTATYIVTQADLDHGSINDSAIASGSPPSGPPIDSPPSTATVATTQNPALSIAKSASPASVSAVGDTVTYTFLVTNTGNVSLTGVSVDDTQQPPAGGLASGPTCQSLSSPAGSCSGSSTSLAPGQVATFTATYIVTQADLDHGSINDSAIASGSPPSGPPIDSPPSTATVPVTQTPALSIAKSASPASVSAVGDTVTYTFLVTNAGNVSLTGVSVDDTQQPPAGGLASGPTCQSLSGPSGTCSGSSTSLAPGQSATFTATYIVTQADLDNASIDDSAIASGSPPSGPPIDSPPSTASVPVTQNAALSIVKSAAPASVSAVGDTVTYTFAVTNTGNVGLTGVSVDDTQEPPAGSLASGPTCQSLSSPAGSCSGSSTSLAPGQSASFTATYIVTQADLDHGSINDSAIASGSPPSGPPIDSPPSTASVPVTQSPALSIVKSASPASVSAVGDTVTYTFAVTNTGNVGLTGVSVADTQEPPAGGLASGPTCQSLSSPAGSCSGSSTSLAPGQSASFTATYTVTQADLDHGSINDSAIASGSPPSGPPIDSPPSTATVVATQNPALSIAKSASPASVSAVGDIVTYTFAVTNTGNVDLTDVSVDDTQQPPAGGLTSGPMCQSLSSPAGSCRGFSTSLAPGQVATFTATYIVTQADLDNGSIDDSATASGSPPSGPPIDSPPSTASVPVTQSPALTITKSASPASVSAVGDTVTYTFAVTNTGNVDLSGVSVNDTQEPPAGGLTSGPTCQSLSSPTGSCSGSSTSLAPGQSATFTATYTVTQVDLDHGSINDSATATGSPPSGPPIDSPPSTASVPVTQSPALSIVKSAAPASVSAVGDIVTYTFAVTNTGNVDLSGVSVADTQEPPAGGLASGPTCQSLSSPSGTCSGSSTSLAPGQSASFTATYTVTQADLDNGSINDSAIASGSPPSGPPIDSPPSTASVPATQSPALTITKSASPASVSAVGDTVTYTFGVTNTGNVDLTGVSVNDTQEPPAGSLTTGPTCQSLSDPSGTCSGSSTSLAPGQSATFTATYIVTQADLDHGSIHDSATATGTPPSGPPIDSPPSTASVPATQSPALTDAKSASPASVSAVGDTVTYTFAVTNTGNVDLTGVSVDDTQEPPAGGLASGPTCQSLSSPTGTCSGSSTSLAPGQSATFTATYIVTQADLDHGSINDSATATGSPPSGPPIDSPPSTATVPVTQNPALSITKSADPASVGAVGQTVTYTFAVTNTGNVGLSGVHVTDTQLPPAGGLTSGPTCQSLSSPSGTCSGSSTSLVPGQAATFTATYIVTQADLNHQSIHDSATATGTPPTGPSVTSPPATATVPAIPSPAVSITKSAAPASVSTVGQTVTYTFAVKNTGNLDLTGVSVDDTQQAPAGGLASGPTCQSLSSPPGTCSGSSTSLAPGQVATFTATYIVTQADLDHGSIHDSATATGTPPTGPSVTSPPATATVPVKSSPALSITKSANPGTVSTVGQTVTYTFAVKNTGNVDLTGVSVDDTQQPPAGSLASGPTCESLSGPSGTCSGSSTSLVPGQSATFTATYTVTQADLNHGSITDSATATGMPPAGPPQTSPPATVTVPTANIAHLTVTKVVEEHHAVVGDPLHYRILVVNHGPGAANDVVVHDTPSAPMTVVSVHTSVGHCSVTHGDDVTCVLGTLANGERVTITVASYALTVGTGTNTAKVTTSSINPNPGGATSRATTKVVSPLSLTKTAKPTRIKTGQSVTFTITVKNSSSRKQNNVRVCDNLPATLLYISSNPRSALRGESRCWTIKRLPGHSIRSFKLIANAAPGTSHRVVNVATVHVHGLPTVRARRTIWIGRPPVTPCPSVIIAGSAAAATQPTAHAAC